MAAKMKLNPGENILVDSKRFALQGKKVKFPVRTRCIVTDQRFIYFDLGKMAPFHMQLGLLIMLLVKGKPVSLPLEGMKVGRGTYFKNKKILELKAIDGTTVLLDKFEKSLDWLKEALLSNGIGLSQVGEEEWQVTR
ncbi:MAG: hypothetical protein KAW14_10060 [Candidatus Aegiribacteria sp.]|jgi:hypothetical protein|nr:hypothetical protein [Candidatus Aegiribacteria sp.]